MPQGSRARAVEEVETDSGWRYRFAIGEAVEDAVVFELTVSWHDHEDIAGGGVPPSELAEAAALTLVDYWAGTAERGAPPAARIDLSTARRLVPGFVDEVRSKLVR